MDFAGEFEINSVLEQAKTIGVPIFMQYVGLEDKNNREIYEGDILKHYKLGDTDKKESIIGEVIFHSGGVYAGYWPVGFANESEVLGNIYENPDLIKLT